ncbi:hypothetical protein DPMN_154689 [Dreissena polymorpha]|uniref:Uncharacterized protein n=1 Tax=Dreissena polymorpha TaxID=45954 RepID=A0A9D4FRA9_DREPO|nr:hypothetical protein DPMN_154689 [Dreissena polymorpha]
MIAPDLVDKHKINFVHITFDNKPCNMDNFRIQDIYCGSDGPENGNIQNVMSSGNG